MVAVRNPKTSKLRDKEGLNLRVTELRFRECEATWGFSLSWLLSTPSSM